MRRILVLTSVAVLLLAACGDGGEPAIRQTGKTIQTGDGTARPYGSGAGKVWVVTPKNGKPRSVVVFIHGWTATSPFEWHQVWLDHLLARGSAVIFPVYQSSGDDSEFVTSPYNLRDGLEEGFRALGGVHLPVVVAGYSVGGALAFYYAAAARRWHLPDPVAVYSIFPFDPLRIDPGLSLLGEPPGHVRVLMLVGDMDTTVGRYGGDTFWKWLASVPPELKTYRLLRSQKHGSLWFDHEAPTDVFDATMRNVFWEPLDRLVAQARAAS